jgi:hypothetical protein
MDQEFSLKGMFMNSREDFFKSIITFFSTMHDDGRQTFF